MGKLSELSAKEIIELRIKCLEPFVVVAAKANIEQDTVMKKAEVAWKFATKTLEDTPDNDTQE